MRSIRITLVSSAAVFLLAACAGVASFTSPSAGIPRSVSQGMQAAASDRIADGVSGTGTGFRQISPGWLLEVARGSRHKLYVSDDGAGAVYVYNAGNPTVPVGTITNGISEPVGNFVDAKGNLYVTNLGGNSVTLYARGKTTPYKTYTSGLSQPTSIVVGNDGTLYVSEFPTGTVFEYDSGTTTPARTLSLKSVQGVALDSSNNLYATYTNPSSGIGAVEKFKPKATVGRDLGIALGNPGDIKIDSKDNLLVGDQKSDTVNFYKPGGTTPYGAISTPRTPFKFALNRSEKLLYVATGINELDIFDAVPNGKRVGVLTSGLQSTSGVSLDPTPLL